jgi:hypothetical protein
MITERFFEHVNDLIESRVEYETTHQDAGDNYFHLAGEGSFDYYNGDDRLKEYCKGMGIDIDGLDIYTLAQDVIFWGRMQVGGAYCSKQSFLVASYPVGEIEIQVDDDDIGARFTPYLINKLNRHCDAYFTHHNRDGYAFAYVATDSYWEHVCDPDTIRDIVENLRDRG